MVVKCPNCGQQLRGEPGAQGKCPKCQTQLIFPQGDRRYGEPIKCPHCGQMQVYKNGDCISCGKRLDGEFKYKRNDKHQSEKKAHKKSRLIPVVMSLIIVGTIVSGSFFLPSILRKGQKQSIYHDNSGYSAGQYSEGNYSGTDSVTSDNSSGGGYTSGYISDDYKLALFILAQEEVCAQLKSPSSAVFPSSYTGSDVVYSRDGDTYGLISWVEAANSYGVQIRQNYTMFATISGGKISDVTCIIGIPE